MSKNQHFFIYLVIFSLIVGACTPSRGTNSGEATQTPALLDDWSAVKSSGVLRVGTAADYAPFSYFNNTGQLDGFDIALIRELARRLGVSAQITDFAFDGLPDALFLGQADAAIAALSITPDRANRVDFTSLYYAGADGILARADSPIASVNSAENLSGQRIAVQRGTVYEEWARDNLVNPGLIQPEGLFAYGRPEDAIRDLKESRVDIVMLDLLPAEEAARDGVKLVGQGLIPQQFAIALRKGSTLTAELNRALAEAQTDGTVGELAETYLNVKAQVAIATPPPATPSPVYPTPLPPACVNGMAYVADLSFPDMNMTNPPVLQPGQSFTKGWRVRNTGTCNWDPSFFLSYVRGNVPAAQMNGQPTPISTVVPPGSEADIWVNLVAPLAPGAYQGFWQMTTPDGVNFGQTIWVGISVPGADPTPLPGEPNIASFIATPANVVAGQCTTLFWYVLSGVNQVDLTRNGDWLWVNAPFEGNYTDCPAAAGVYTYVLTAQGPGGVRQSQVQVMVAPSGAAR